MSLSNKKTGIALAAVLIIMMMPGVLLASGELDTTFGGDGIVTTPIWYDSEKANAVAVDPDGKIVVAGYSFNGVDSDFAVVRYNPDGSLDTSFDADGKVTTDLGAFDLAQSVAIDVDGKIIMAGNSGNFAGTDFAVVRYNPDGSLDTSFGGDGVVTTAIGVGRDDGYAVVIDADGKIVVAGVASNGNDQDFAVVRYNPDGSLDAGFDGDGKATVALGSYARSYGVSIAGNGKIVQSGYFNDSGDEDFAVVRYNSDGSLDASFDGDGKAVTDIDGHPNRAYASTIDGDGRIVVAGHSFDGTDYNFAVVRYNPDGTLDASFDGDGKMTTVIGSPNDYALGVAVDGTGNVIVVGYFDNGADDDFATVRYVGVECGNAVPEGAEACDDGNEDNADACLTTCVSALCGDGYLNEGEEGCDDGNLTDDDGCNASCGIEATASGGEVGDANPDVDFSSLEAGGTVSLNAPDPRAGGAALTAKSSHLPDSCSCEWSIDPATLGTYASAEDCHPDLTLNEAGSGTLTVTVDCGADGSGTFQQAVTVAVPEASSASSASSGGCSLIR